MIFFHNHPPEGGTAAIFPNHADFGVAALLSFLVYREHLQLPVGYRVVQLGKDDAVVSYGFKGTALEEIRKTAQEYRTAVAAKADTAQIELSQGVLDYHLDQESFDEYLQYACPVDLNRSDTEACRTLPQYFIWPSERFFVHDRPQ